MPKPENHLAIHYSVYNMSNIYRWLLQLSKNLQLVRHIQHTLWWNYRCLKNYRNTSKFEVAISAFYQCLPKYRQLLVGGGITGLCLQKIQQNFRWLLQLAKDILRQQKKHNPNKICSSSLELHLHVIFASQFTEYPPVLLVSTYPPVVLVLGVPEVAIHNEEELQVFTSNFSTLQIVQVYIKAGRTLKFHEICSSCLWYYSWQNHLQMARIQHVTSTVVSP